MEKVLCRQILVFHTRRINVESLNKTFEFRDIVIISARKDMPQLCVCVHAHDLVLMYRNFIERNAFLPLPSTMPQHTHTVHSVRLLLIVFFFRFVKSFESSIPYAIFILSKYKGDKKSLRKRDYFAGNDSVVVKSLNYWSFQDGINHCYLSLQSISMQINQLPLAVVEKSVNFQSYSSFYSWFAAQIWK